MLKTSKSADGKIVFSLQSVRLCSIIKSKYSQRFYQIRVDRLISRRKQFFFAVFPITHIISCLARVVEPHKSRFDLVVLKSSEKESKFPFKIIFMLLFDI